jgi:hypothetical protein
VRATSERLTPRRGPKGRVAGGVGLVPSYLKTAGPPRVLAPNNARARSRARRARASAAVDSLVEQRDAPLVDLVERRHAAEVGEVELLERRASASAITSYSLRRTSNGRPGYVGSAVRVTAPAAGG